MWIAPFIIGIIVTGFSWLHLLQLISIFFAYISISPFLQGIRNITGRKVMWKYTALYLAIAFLFAIPLLVFFPKLIYIAAAIVPLFMINIYYVKKKRERSLVNDTAAMAALTSTFFASYFIGVERYDLIALLSWLVIFLFFFGSVLYVKSIYREKENKTFKIMAKVYMILLPLLGLSVYGIYLFFGYLFSTIRLFVSPSHLVPKQVGIIEIANTVWFILFFFFI